MVMTAEYVLGELRSGSRRVPVLTARLYVVRARTSVKCRMCGRELGKGELYVYDYDSDAQLCLGCAARVLERVAGLLRGIERGWEGEE